MEQNSHDLTPAHFFQVISAFHVSAALKSAIDLKLFTHIASGSSTAGELAAACGAAERGIRILADTMCVVGFLAKNGSEYSLTPESSLFLVETSPAYIGAAAEFLHHPTQKRGFEDLTNAVRQGGSTVQGEGSLDPESPMWATFARSMTGMMVPAANKMASELGYERERPIKVLDIAAGHGMFGLTIARHYPNAEIYALDWPNVLVVARENAVKFGVADRFHEISGSAFDVPLGDGYDVVLVTNFLHHFDVPTCETFLKRVHSAVKDDGQVLTLEFVPNEDRVSPPGEALFSLIMLAGTPAGDAYTYNQLRSMLEKAGFSHNEHRPMPGMPQHWIVSRK